MFGFCSYADVVVTMDVNDLEPLPTITGFKLQPLPPPSARTQLQHNDSVQEAATVHTAQYTDGGEECHEGLVTTITGDATLAVSPNEPGDPVDHNSLYIPNEPPPSYESVCSKSVPLTEPSAPEEPPSALWKTLCSSQPLPLPLEAPNITIPMESTTRLFFPGSTQPCLKQRCSFTTIRGFKMAICNRSKYNNGTESGFAPHQTTTLSWQNTPRQNDKYWNASENILC